jgi:hypothetical protein
MHHYYRFIKSKFDDCKQKILEQSQSDKFRLRLLSENDAYEDSDMDRINVVLKNDVIIDIYKG